MDKIVATNMIGGNPKRERLSTDFYPTPPEVTIALLDYLQLPKRTRIWEPACGRGHMVDVMRSQGYKVTGTDLQTGTDFLTTEAILCDWIITNPPFSVADKFILRCAEHRRPFALLLKSQYWHAAKRLPLFRKLPPTYICPLTWRPDFLFEQQKRGAPLMDVCWCIWTGCGGPIYFPLSKPIQEG